MGATLQHAHRIPRPVAHTPVQTPTPTTTAVSSHQRRRYVLLQANIGGLNARCVVRLEGGGPPSRPLLPLLRKRREMPPYDKPRMQYPSRMCSEARTGMSHNAEACHVMYVRDTGFGRIPVITHDTSNSKDPAIYGEGLPTPGIHGCGRAALPAVRCLRQWRRCSSSSRLPERRASSM